MVPLDILVHHVIALLVIWGTVLLAGYPVAVMLRLRLGFPGYVLIGIVAWAISIYVFRFEGGLDVALAVACVGCVTAMVWQRQRLLAAFRPAAAARIRAAGILALGCLVYASVLLWNYVPLAADGAVVGATTRMIALHQGLPDTYAPWFPELFFPTVNLALPTIGSVAISLGSEPASVVLALAQLSFSAWILGAYVLLRRWIRPEPAAILAVAQAWGGRWAQNTIGWGGFPTVAGMAIGLLAVHLMWEAARRHDARSVLALGITVAAMPLVHGISAAVWLYAAAPVAGLTLLLSSPSRLRTTATFLAAAGVSCLVLLCYLMAGQFHMSQAEIDWSREHLTTDAPLATSWLTVLPVMLNYLKSCSGSVIVWLGAVSWMALLVMGRWRSALGLLGCLMLLILILVNARWWILPFSMMLYPDRAVYWGGPLAALAMALFWKEASRRWPQFTRARLAPAIGVLLLSLAFWQHLIQYQRIVRQPTVDGDGWAALSWARDNLTAQGTFVQATPGSVGCFLPLCASVPTNAWQVHHCAKEECAAVLQASRPTHRLYVRDVDPMATTAGNVVFQNTAVTIVEVLNGEPKATIAARSPSPPR